MLNAGYQSFGLSSGGLTESVPFEFNLSGVLDFSDPRWITLGEVHLFSRLRWAIIIEDPYERNEQFKNPSRFQFGWITTSTDDYVREQLQIKHLQQEIVTTSPSVYVRGSLKSYPMRMEREAGGGQSIAVNDNLWCGCIQAGGVVQPPPSNSTFAGEFSVGIGRWRSRIFPGRDTYRENTDIYDLPGVALNANATDFGYFNKLSGVLYPGLTIGITVEHFWPQVQSNVVPVQPPLILSGTPSIPVYDYTCVAGASIPLPTNPPCDPTQLDLNGGTTYSCGNNA